MPRAKQYQTQRVNHSNGAPPVDTCTLGHNGLFRNHNLCKDCAQCGWDARVGEQRIEAIRNRGLTGLEDGRRGLLLHRPKPPRANDRTE